MYASGMSVGAIARALDTSYMAIRQQLVKAGKIRKSQTAQEPG
jgi:predicted ArsR family transcriptional regulator